MTVGAPNTLIRRFPGNGPQGRRDRIVSCARCAGGRCDRCTRVDDTKHILAGLPALHPACLHDCTNGMVPA